MWTICKKEWRQFFSTLTSYIAIIIFLLVTGLWLFVFPDSNLLDFGYASLSIFFSIAPWVLLFLIPTITMRSISEEYKLGTFELLRTLPLKPNHIIIGKYLGALGIIIVAILPTIIYVFSLQYLSTIGGIDFGQTAGSYIGLFLLSALYTAIGICISSYTNNTIIAFLATAFICFLFYSGFEAFSKLVVFTSSIGYYIEMLGIAFHYRSISRGVIELRDIVYFITTSFFFLLLAQRKLNIK